jgi:L-lactate dehydrogenase
MVGGILLKDYCPVCERRKECEREKTLNSIFLNVKNSAYEIIKKKGETSYGIGLALARITSAIIADENSVLPVSVLVEDYLGMKDLYLSLPSIVNKSGVRQVLPLKLDKEEKEHFRNSAGALKEVLKKAGF